MEMADKPMLDYYRNHSPWTDPGQQAAMLRDLANDIPSIVAAVQGCLIHGGLLWLYRLQPVPAREGGAGIRRTEALLRRVAALDAAPLGTSRPAERRLVVNCRQFAVLTCAILRHQGVSARARAGYALYTWGRGMYENHWICEYYRPGEARWAQVDAQLDRQQKELMRIDWDTLDLPTDKFVSAGEGWRRYREGAVDIGAFGLGGRDGWNALGWGMVMPNVTCDAMALNKTELLPWDVNPYWERTQAQMSAADMETIEGTARLCRQVDERWAELRAFYQAHPLLRMPEGFAGE
jgi:hypothetical protein